MTNKTEDRKVYLACDMGGTEIKYGLVSPGRILSRRSVPANAHVTFAERLDQLKRDFNLLCDQNQLSLESLAGFGLSFPAIVDYERGRILDNYGKFPGSETILIHEWSLEHLGIPGAVDNDARCALQGERVAGAAVGRANVVMFTLGTGIGSAALVEGKMLRGSSHLGGNLLGHLTVNIQGENCHCGNIGCAESETSKERLRARILTNRFYGKSSLKNLPEPDYKALFEAVRVDDPCAVEVSEDILNIWGSVVVSAIHSLGPSLVILGGGIMRSADIILPYIRNYVKTHSRYIEAPVEIQPAQLGNDASLLGCQKIIEERRHEKK